MASPRNVAFFSLLLLFLRLGSSSEEALKVQLGLYYESLCPYSADFVVNSLARIFSTGLISIVDLALFPYGNARVSSDGVIKCQHGPNECFLNTVEACAINAWPDVAEHFKFIYCVEQLVVEGRYAEWKSCFQTLSLDPQPVLDCLNNGYGNQLELYYAAATDALKPPHKYVPWVVVDGRPLYDDYENFESEVCKAYTGDLPPACEELVLAMTTTKTGKQTVGACYANEKLVHTSTN